MTTPAELVAELERLDNIRTPGPLRLGAVAAGEVGVIGGTRFIEADYDAEPQLIAMVHPSTDGEGSNKIDAEERDANAAMFVLLANNIPTLLALAKEHAAMRTALERLTRDPPIKETPDFESMVNWMQDYALSALPPAAGKEGKHG